MLTWSRQQTSLDSLLPIPKNARELQPHQRIAQLTQWPVRQRILHLIFNNGDAILLPKAMGMDPAFVGATQLDIDKRLRWVPALARREHYEGRVRRAARARGGDRELPRLQPHRPGGRHRAVPELPVCRPEEREYLVQSIFQAKDIFVQDVPPFEARTYCASETLPRGAHVTNINSHVHKRGVLWNTCCHRTIGAARSTPVASPSPNHASLTT